MDTTDKDKAAAEELYALVKQFRQWTKENLTTKSAERARFVNNNLMYLEITVRQHPEQAHAALYCANAVWHMLFEDAWTGYGVRHGRKSKPYFGEVSRDDVVKALNAIRREEPGISKTKAVPKIAKRLARSQRTVWNKLKE